MTGRVLISAAELAELMRSEQVVLVDTRDAAHFSEAHIPGAVNMREVFTYLAMSTPAGEAQLVAKFAEAFGAAGLSGAETAVIYEQSMNTGFAQACRGYVLLRHLGYPKIKVLHGGFDAWRAADLPVSNEPVHPVKKKFPLQANAAPVLVNLEVMKAAIADKSIVKLDVRDVDEWIAESSSPYGKDFCPRKGRIPGSVWLEWYRMMKPTPAGQMFKSREEILAECATVSITQDTPVIVFCFKGARASNTFVALEEAGVKDVKIYFGSWNEWSRDPSLPIEEGLPYVTSAAAKV